MLQKLTKVGNSLQNVCMISALAHCCSQSHQWDA